MGRNWKQERKRDFYYKKAKAEGYRSRAAYKLLQANGKYRFIKPGDRVVDLGSAPGGWLQAAGRLVGDKGEVLGVDVKPVAPLKATNIRFMVGDVLDPSLPSKILEAFKTKVDVVLSDASPNISGVWEVDHARQIELAQAAFTLAKAVLRKGGVCMVKVFEGPLTKEFQRELKQAFEVVRVFKPQASRARSSELYFLGLGFREDSSQQV